MVIELIKPEIEKFLDDQVKAGHFPSAEAAVEAAIQEIMLHRQKLDDDTIAAIVHADQQYDAGQFVEWRDVRDDLRKKYLNK